MKKVLSFVLAAAMLVSLFCAVPAQAKPYAEYPLVFEDFEDGTVGTTAGGGAKWVSGGANGSNGAVHVSLTGVQNQDITIPCTTPVQPDATVKFSTWVKMANTEVTKDNVSFIIYGRANFPKTDAAIAGEEASDYATVTGWEQVYASNAGLKMGEWVYVSYEFKWDGSLTAFPPAGYGGSTDGETIAASADVVGFDRICLRVANGGTSGAASKVSSMDFYLDDITYEFIPDNFAETDAIGKNIVNGGDLNTTADMSKFGIGGSPSIVASTSEDPAPDGSAGYLKLQPTNGAVYWPQLSQNMTWEPNHMYHVSYYMRLDTPKDTDKTTATVLQGNAGQEKEVELSSVGGWLYQSALPTLRIPDTNGFNTDYPGRVFYEVANFDNGWQKVDYYFVHEYRTIANQQFNTCLRLFANKNQNVQCNVSFSLDAYKIIDMGAVSNGNFETEVPNALVYKNKQDTKQSVLGWSASASTLSYSDDAAEGNKSMQVSVTGAGGSATQGIEMAPDRLYKLSFRAKGIGLERDMPLAVQLDRKVTTESAYDVWDVPTYEYYTGTHEVCTSYTADVKANQEWKLTNEWQTYTCYISNSFGLKEGKTAEDAMYYGAKSNNDPTLVYRGTSIPRLPIMYWNIDNNPVGLTYLIDDVKLESVNTFPAVSNVQVNGKVIPGKEVTVSYDYESTLNLADTYSIVRAYSVDANGQRASIGSFKATEGFIVPESAIGKTLEFEVLPVDANKICGMAVTTAAADPGKWAKLYVEEDNATRAYSSEDTTATVIFAAYNGKELVDVETVENVVLTANTKADIAVPADFVTTDATSVKVMLWNSLTGVAPLCEAVEK